MKKDEKIYNEYLDRFGYFERLTPREMAIMLEQVYDLLAYLTRPTTDLFDLRGFKREGVRLMMGLNALASELFRIEEETEMEFPFE